MTKLESFSVLVLDEQVSMQRQRTRPKLYLLCGKTGSGKTTFARELEREHEVVRFTVDEWMIRLFGRHMPREVFDARLAICKELVFELTEKVLAAGVGAVLDFGAWSRAERERIRWRFEHGPADVVLVYLSVPDDEIRGRLARRNQQLPADTYEITDDMFQQFSSWFEAPGESERPFVVGSDRLDWPQVIAKLA